MQIDRPDVVAEVTAAFTDYEEALVADDAERAVSFFAPGAVGFGIADRQTGRAEQLAWRRAQPPLPPGRRLKDTVVATHGADLAVAPVRLSGLGRAGPPVPDLGTPGAGLAHRHRPRQPPPGRNPDTD